MDLDEFLKHVSETDDLGLLAEKPKVKPPTADERLVSKFMEIVEFVKANGREPNQEITNITEFQLASRLASIRNNQEQSSALIAHDELGLLDSSNGVADVSDVALHARVAEPEAKYTHKHKKPEDIESLDDIFSDDALGLLGDDSESIFNIKNVPKKADMPKSIASRKRCKDFDNYQPLFEQCHADLKSGEKEQYKFTGEQQIQKGQFFILHGVMCYVADMEERVKKNGKVNARLHLIFENGTESDMLLRSLATELYKDELGRRVMPKSEDALNDMLGVTDEDQAAGYIYILKSLSTNPEIHSIQHLYKIGYSTTPVERRIANAEREPTYLMAPVQLVASYKCFNMNTQKFENLLHTFFGKACLDVDIVDLNGKLCKPREWFIAPLQAIEMAIQLLINREIVNYQYDCSSLEVVLRQDQEQ